MVHYDSVMLSVLKGLNSSVVFYPWFHISALSFHCYWWLKISNETLSDNMKVKTVDLIQRGICPK